MTRVVSLFLPTWSTDRVRRKAGHTAAPEVPLALIGHDGRRRIVVAVDATAHAAGLRIGMPATRARVLVPGLLVQEATLAADAEALDRLVLWILQHYAPVVAADPPDGIVIDTTGADHLYGGEQAMLEGMIERMAAVGITARVSVADTWGAAHALARFGDSSILISPPGTTRAAIAPLPIAALRLPSELVGNLRTLGFDRISHLLTQPRAPLTLRFGPELGRRIDQAMGLVPEPIEPIRPADLIEVRQSFPEPIGAAETIARYIGKLVAQLCAGLDKRGLGVRRLDLLCHRVDNILQAIRVGTALPVRDVKRLTRLLCDKIETIEPGFGIEILTLTATIVEPVGGKQASTSLIDDVAPDISDLVDILANRVGGQRIYRAAPVASDVPERSVCRVPAMFPETGASWPGDWPRPPRLLDRPELIEIVALLPDHPPVSFTWRGVRRRVKRADGPERLFGEWWKRDAELVAVRDYFRVEDEAGERFWIYRAGDGEDVTSGSHSWFLHGVFG